MGDSADLFEDLRERGYEERAGKARGSSEGEAVEAREPSAPSAAGASDEAVDLEAPLLEERSEQQYERSSQAIREQEQAPPVLEPVAGPPESDPLLYVCRVLSIVTAVGALLCLVVNAISLFRSFDYRGFDYRVSVGFLAVLPFLASFFLLLFVVQLQIMVLDSDNFEPRRVFDF